MLGPSGSGKTTLLKSVVGQLAPTEGWVKVFGFQPNQPGSQIPGSAIGYMPQELAVYEDFTIKETLWYFGRLYRIPSKIIKERIEFLLTFLDLPRSKRLIVNMSGGQKRRVSLASALVHSPPLLILDEPTVGVDPLLRQSIWQHLVTLTQTEKITVIVTTHYIEEARRANIVGLMRRGKLLAENAPEELMLKHQSSSLEDVFLKLCVTDTMRRAQKFATLAGIPVQLAIQGASSAIPTPEVQSKRAHSSDQSQLDSVLVVDHHQRHSSPAESADASGQNNNNNTADSFTNSLSSSSSSTASSNSSNNGEPPADSLSKCTAETAEADMVAVSQLDASKLGKVVGKNCKFLQQQQQAVAKRPMSKFHFKFPSSLLNRFSSGERATSANDKAAEGRRQSGSHFIEQLMSRYQAEQQQQQQVAGANAKPLGLPADQLLSCDTSAPGARNGKPLPVDHLKVPEICVRGGGGGGGGSSFGGDSGASSNGSSQNHSPNAIAAATTTTTTTTVNTNDQQQQQQQVLSGCQNSYVNHSYQPSECGSTYNDLALIAGARVAVQPEVGEENNNDDEEEEEQQEVVRYNNDHYQQEPGLFLDPGHLSTMSPGGKYDYKKLSMREYCDTIGTITWKNYIRLKRNVPLLLFQFLLPAIQVILFCICVGNDPFDIPVAVVNEESSAEGSIAALSTQFLHSIDRHLVRQVSYGNLQEAIESVRLGQNWGVVHIPENFTLSVHKRFTGLEGEIEDSTLENSTIKVYPDMTNQPIGHAMEVAFRRAYNDLSKQTFDFLGLNPALSDPPIRMQEAIYGKLEMQNYLQYMSPGVLISISYIMATGLTSLAFIIERRDGLYDRTLAAGVGHVQMLLSHSIVQLLVMIVQISLVVFFTFVIYKVPTKGPFVWVFILLLLQGLAGMSFGLMVSAICKEENTAIMMILGTFYPNLLLAGVIWPIEAIPHWLRWFSYLQPQTLPTQSLRDLIVRGWDIDQKGVWSGFAVTAAWLLLFLAISCLSFRIKK